MLLEPLPSLRAIHVMAVNFPAASEGLPSLVSGCSVGDSEVLLAVVSPEVYPSLSLLEAYPAFWELVVFAPHSLLSAS